MTRVRTPPNADMIAAVALMAYDPGSASYVPVQCDGSGILQTAGGVPAGLTAMYILPGSGAPVDGVTGMGILPTGGLYRNTDNSQYYVQTGPIGATVFHILVQG